MAEEFLMDQMHLSQIGLRGIGGGSRPMANLRAVMRVPNNPKARDELDRVGTLLAKQVIGGSVNGHD